jgi:hypothetical protein
MHLSRRELLRASLGLACATLTGSLLAGCGDKSGRQLGPTSTQSPNLVIDNRSHNTLHVYVDNSEIGEAAPNAKANFQILSGERLVEVRERGHTTRHSFGRIHFGFNDVELTYRP